MPRSVWIVGGDGWAYDIGYGGLDHVLASGRNVNILVLDTEVYSNTGGQASKATQRGAVAKFAAAGKSIGKKDLGMIAMAYGNVYVAQVAMGANPVQTVRTFLEAEAWTGPSLIIAYSHCIAHGIDMATGMTHQRDAVKSGYLTLYHYDPRLGMDGADQPLKLDSRKPTMPVEQFTMKEGRFAMLAQADPARAKGWPAGAGTTPTSAGSSTSRWPACTQRGRSRGHGDETTPAAKPATAQARRGAPRRCNNEHRPAEPLPRPRAQNPLVASASPMTGSIDSLRRLRGRRRRGRGAAVAVRGADRARGDGHPRPDAVRRRNCRRSARLLPRDAATTAPGPASYLKLVADAKKALSVPVIASLNGSTPGGWTSIAKQLEEAGADAIELNVYCVATNPDDTSADGRAALHRTGRVGRRSR